MTISYPEITYVYDFNDRTLKKVRKYRVVDVCNQNYFVGIWIVSKHAKKKKKMEYGMSTRRYLKIRLIFNFIWKDYIK